MSDFSILELYRQEVEVQADCLTQGLLAVEKGATSETLDSMMRAAHSLKGAARLTNIEPVVQAAHAMEDVLEAAARGAAQLTPERVDRLLAGVDFIVESSRQSDELRLQHWAEKSQGRLEALLHSFQEPAGDDGPAPEAVLRAEGGEDDRLLRLPTERLQLVMETTGELRVAMSWLVPFREALLRLRHRSRALTRRLGGSASGTAAAECYETVVRLLDEFEERSLGLDRISGRLREQVLACQMLPFSEGTRLFPRMVRDLARTLGKNVRLVLEGGDTPVDRSILKALEAPLTHLLRNATDHGIESPGEREIRGKPPEASITLSACHRRGMLSIVVEDDGRGIDPEKLREVVQRRGLVNGAMAGELTPRELIDFLFLPRFSTTDDVTEVSGRGVGLDAVRDSVVELGGRVDVDPRPRRGARFELLLPLSLSVIRALLVQISGEAYALPLNRVDQVLRVPREQLEELEGRQFVRVLDSLIGLVAAQQILDLPAAAVDGDEVSVVLLGRYGLVVDRLVGKADLVVQRLDPVLGKVPGVASGAVSTEGSPVLILDTEDVLLTIEKVVSHGRLSRIEEGQGFRETRSRQRVLVVDDSVTVREVERKLLEANGYRVDVAVDGMDGWNALQRGAYDLVISDVDMPRMDGFRLVRLVRESPELKSLPVIIVSYKDREEDRLRGLEAGADRYLTKGSFHDRSLLDAVLELIGES